MGVEQAAASSAAQPRATHSLRVIAECPITFISITHHHRALLPAALERFQGVLLAVLQVQVRAQAREHEAARARGERFGAGAGGSLSPAIAASPRLRAAFGDLVLVQIKTLSLVVHLLRTCFEQIKLLLPQLADVMVRLLQDCPAEKPVPRKELLVAFRNIMNLGQAHIFFPRIDDLLDVRTLNGDGLTNYETRRPLAYALLSDLMHHSRESLSAPQITRAVEIFTDALHEEYLGTNLTTMSVGLLMNLAPHIRALPDKAEARYLLMSILDAIARKFATMNYEFDNARKVSRANRAKLRDPAYHMKKDDGLFANPARDPAPDWDEVDIFSAQPVKTLHHKHRPFDPVNDNKVLFAFLVRKLGNVFFELKRCCPDNLNIDPAFLPPNWSEVSHGFSAEEVGILRNLFRQGARLFRYYGSDKQTPSEPSAPPVPPGKSAFDVLVSTQTAPIDKEEKDLLETFGTLFHCVDPATFFEIFHTEIPYLHDLMLEHPALMHLPQFFLVCEATSSAFAGMTLQYLMGRMEEVGSDDIQQAKILLRMFKLSFLAVGMFAEQNEHVLHPHITEIVTKCITLAGTAKQPMSYFILLRSLFRSIGGSRFDMLYKDLLPLLEMLLETFNTLLLNARSTQERDFFVELTLTVPARLSHLLPHLCHLMRPIVAAIRAGSDLVSQGLRTLELCVDNLTADYLDPIMEPFMDELMGALWQHLKPHPYNHFVSHTSLRILGKLGGRNRKYLTFPPRLTFKEYTDDAPSIDLRFAGSAKEKAFPLDLGVDLAITQLTQEPRDVNDAATAAYYKQQAYQLLSSQLKLLIGADHVPLDLAALIRLAANELADGSKGGKEVPDILATSGRRQSRAKLEAQEKMLQKLLRACIVATTVPELAGKAQPFLDDVCRHFVVIDIARTLALNRHVRRPFEADGGEGPLHLDTKPLAEAILESLSAVKVEERDAATAVLKSMYHTAEVAFGAPGKVGQLSLFSNLARTFCHACNSKEWFTKAGGTLGIRVLALELEWEEAWLHDRQPQFVRALMFVVKDTPSDLPASTRISAEETLMAMLRRYTTTITKEDLTNDKVLSGLCTFLVCELAHQSQHVRRIARQALEVVARNAQCEVWEILLPLRDKLLKPIFNKPLRALPFPTQVGYIDAINYCLTLKNGVLYFGEQLTRLLMETLALVDADDEMLAHRPHEYKTAQQINAFRVACLRLLSTAMSYPEFSNTPNNPARLRVLTVFFKCLHARPSEIIEAAKVGMRDYLAHTPKLPRDVLQHGLRPILMSLQDAKRLSVPGLQGLARLLALLNNHFKVEIGLRLLDHTKVIADDRVRQRASFHLLEQNPQMKITIAVFNIFHLLPPAAAAYLKDLVDKLMQLEKRLRRTTWSPLREPIMKFINRYPEESWTFFRDRLGDEAYGRFFGQILAEPISAPLRQKVVANAATLLATGFPAEGTEGRLTYVVNAIHATHSLCQFDETRDWLASQPDLRQAMLAAGCRLRAQARSGQLSVTERFRAVHGQEQLLQIFTTHLRQHPTDLDFLFDVVNRMPLDQLKSTLTWHDYVFRTIVSSDDLDLQRSLIRRSAEMLGQAACPVQVQSWCFKYLTNPILLKDVQRSWGHRSSLLNLDLIEAFNDRVWKHPPTDHLEEKSQVEHGNLCMEILQFTTILLKYHHDLLQEFRRDIIKFSWSFVRMEDIITKSAGYVLVAYFIVFYETPPKLVLQIYGTLLKAQQNESMSLVLQALDVLGPSLPKRALSHGGQSQPWLRWPRRGLAETNGNSSQVMCILQFLLKHPNLFYPIREEYATIIISYLPKIAGPQTALADTRRLALSLIGLIWHWEKRRVRELNLGTASPASRKRSAAEAGLDADAADEDFAPGEQSLGREVHEYQIPVEFRLMLVKYLTTFICSSAAALPERYPVHAAQRCSTARSTSTPIAPSAKLVEEAVKLLRNFLSPNHWGDLDIELYSRMFEPILASEKAEQPDEKQTTLMINALQVVRAVLAYRPDSWIVERISSIQSLLEKSIVLENAEVQDCLHGIEDGSDSVPSTPPIIQRILDVLPAATSEGDESDADQPPEFVTYLGTTAGERLSSGKLISAINILWTLSRCRPEQVDQHFVAILKAFSHQLAKEHVAAYMPRPPGMPQRSGDAPGDPDFEECVDLISKTIDLLMARMPTLGEHRRPFLSIIGQVVDRSQNQQLCLKILGIAEHWLLESTESWPTSKEKTAVLLKMMSFEHRPDPIPLKRFLELIIRIYEDPKVARTDLAVRLEQAFLIGTRTKDVELRDRFMSLFDKSLSRPVGARLNYVLTSQNWETLKDSFWLTQASHLLLRAVDMTAPVRSDADDMTVFPASFLYGPCDQDTRKTDVMVDSELESLASEYRRFCQELGEVRCRDILEPLIQLQYLDPQVAYSTWTTTFAIAWSTLSQEERFDLEKGIVTLITRPYHQAQLDDRPNVIQALIEGCVKVRPRCKIPPHVLKFLAKTFDA
ncbi:hypothetical protein KEM52_005736, partial [Ascosphaera acerosa]